MELNRLSVIREVKRLELQISLLSKNLKLSDSRFPEDSLSPGLSVSKIILVVGVPGRGCCRINPWSGLSALSMYDASVLGLRAGIASRLRRLNLLE
jgi:hypothetical protein